MRQLLSQRNQPTLLGQAGLILSVRDSYADVNTSVNILGIGLGNVSGGGCHNTQIFKNINGKIISNADKPFVNAADA